MNHDRTFISVLDAPLAGAKVQQFEYTEANPLHDPSQMSLPMPSPIVTGAMTLGALLRGS